MYSGGKKKESDKQIGKPCSETRKKLKTHFVLKMRHFRHCFLGTKIASNATAFQVNPTQTCWDAMVVLAWLQHHGKKWGLNPTSCSNALCSRNVKNVLGVLADLSTLTCGKHFRPSVAVSWDGLIQSCLCGCCLVIMYDPWGDPQRGGVNPGGSGLEGGSIMLSCAGRSAFTPSQRTLVGHPS